MLVQQRHEFILNELDKKGSVTVADISSALSVSAETIRRDLILLETHGKLQRVFGGAVSVELPKHFETLAERFDRNTDLKYELSRYAANLIDEGDTLAIDSGSTAKVFAEVLAERFKALTIITYSNTVFNILKDKFKVILIGGEYIASDDFFGGHIAENMLGQFRFNKAVVFPVAISIKNGVETYTPQTMGLQRVMLSKADRVLVLADSDKFGAYAPMKVFDLSEEHIYVTDSKVNPETVKDFEEKGFVLVMGDGEE